MNLILRQSMAVIAAAAILAYMGLISLSHLRDYVAWPADMLALSIVAALCGMLLALAESKALHLYLIASVVSPLLFGGFWAYATWGVLGSRIPLSNYCFPTSSFSMRSNAVSCCSHPVLCLDCWAYSAYSYSYPKSCAVERYFVTGRHNT